MLSAYHFSKRLAGSTQSKHVKVKIQFEVNKVKIQFKINKVKIHFKINKVKIHFKINKVKIQFKINKVNIQFKVNKVKIQFPGVYHCYSAGLGSLVPIEQLYPPLFTLSGARQEPDSPLKNYARATPGIHL